MVLSPEAVDVQYCGVKLLLVVTFISWAGSLPNTTWARRVPDRNPKAISENRKKHFICT
jgi:hypothetical protein